MTADKTETTKPAARSASEGRRPAPAGGDDRQTPAMPPPAATAVPEEGPAKKDPAAAKPQAAEPVAAAPAATRPAAAEAGARPEVKEPEPQAAEPAVAKAVAEPEVKEPEPGAAEPAVGKDAAAPVVRKPGPEPVKLHTHKDESARGKADRLFAGLAKVPVSRSIVIQNVRPQLDDGRYPIKREVGDTLQVSAEIFREGHDLLKAAILYRRKRDQQWREAPMTQVNWGLAQWSGSVVLYDNDRYVYTIEAWTDVFESWCSEVEKKLGAEQSVALELAEGQELVREAIARAKGEDAEWLEAVLKTLRGLDDGGRATFMLGPDLRAIMARWPDRSTAIRYDRELEVVVDRLEARFAAWYEMFPRSQGKIPGRSATFADCEARIPQIKAMGFNVIYFPPIHPIGRTFRKGKNNSLTAGPEDPGSPYAIGSAEGGHKAIEPGLGTLEDFRGFVKACLSQGLEVALDFAIQCSPDHPWIQEHPEWFLFRPDGSIKYAENPPKKYQDIVNVDFYNEHWHSLWEELKSVIEFWIEQGVKIFRVDNPHTKPVPFWEWLIDDVQSKNPDVLFLSEAFTRPPMLYMLAKTFFTQSYTYFTWRHTKQELTEYFTELTQSAVTEYMRPMLFTNTPDINPPYLQTGGRPAHMVRLMLAATLSSVYGIYSGFELCEATPIPGKEEYLNSEKYEYKVWDWDRPGNIKDFIAKLNWIRGENPALHELDNLRFYKSTDDNILFYGKMVPDRSNMIFVVVNLDPFGSHESFVEFPLADMGIGVRDPFFAEELFSGRRLEWRGSRQWVRLDPLLNPCEIFRVTQLKDARFGA